MSAIDALLERIADRTAGFRGGLNAPPQKRVAVVACMDARLLVGAVLGLAPGDVHVIRNAGGAVTEDVIRSLTISQCLLGTREIMLIHHTDCGMQAFGEGELLDRIEGATGVRPSFAMESFSDVDENLRQSVARLQDCPYLLHKDAIRGFVFEVESGHMREVK